MATTAGWGVTKDGNISSVLQEADVRIIANKKCQNWFRKAGEDDYLDDDFFCAGYKKV